MILDSRAKQSLIFSQTFTVPSTPPDIVAAGESLSNQHKIHLTLVPTPPLLSCRIDTNSEKHLTECNTSMTLPHSSLSLPCPTVRMSLCTPMWQTPQSCSPWSNFTTVVTKPTTPRIQKINKGKDSMVIVLSWFLLSSPLTQKYSDEKGKKILYYLNKLFSAGSTLHF